MSLIKHSAFPKSARTWLRECRQYSASSRLQSRMSFAAWNLARARQRRFSSTPRPRAGPNGSASTTTRSTSASFPASPRAGSRTGSPFQGRPPRRQPPSFALEARRQPASCSSIPVQPNLGASNPVIRNPFTAVPRLNQNVFLSGHASAVSPLSSPQLDYCACVVVAKRM